MPWTLSRRSFVGLSALLGSGLELNFPFMARAAGLFTPKLGIITDELTEDFEKALDFISSHSLGYCEVRELWQKNVLKLSPDRIGACQALDRKPQTEGF